MEEKFSPLIDERNSDLWNDMNRIHKITLAEAGEPGYLTQFDNDEIRIEVDMEDLNPASLTHELLHIYLKDQRVFIASDLKDTIENEKDLKKLFSDSLKEHLGNCLEHSKMLPIYLGRGFKNRDFVRDYDEKVMEEDEFQDLSREYRNEDVVSREAFDKYVGKFFSMKTSNNRHYDYGNIYEGMQKLDPALYEVLEKFWKDWQEFQPGEPRLGYQKALEELASGLLEWKQNNKISYKSEAFKKV